jgi:hypothetical protein
MRNEEFLPAHPPYAGSPQSTQINPESRPPNRVPSAGARKRSVSVRFRDSGRVSGRTRISVSGRFSDSTRLDKISRDRMEQAPCHRAELVEHQPSAGRPATLDTIRPTSCFPGL